MGPWKGLRGPACGQARFLKVGVSVSQARWDWSTAHPRPARIAAAPERRHSTAARTVSAREVWSALGSRCNRLLGRYLGDHLIGGSLAYRRFGGFGLPGRRLGGSALRRSPLGRLLRWPQHKSFNTTAATVFAHRQPPRPIAPRVFATPPRTVYSAFLIRKHAVLER
jgi:hypothetical protein